MGGWGRWKGSGELTSGCRYTRGGAGRGEGGVEVVARWGVGRVKVGYTYGGAWGGGGRGWRGVVVHIALYITN